MSETYAAYRKELIGEERAIESKVGGKMDISALLFASKAVGASDVHLVVSCPPMVRIKGSLKPLEGCSALSAEDINQAFLQLATPEEREHFRNNLELDFAYTLPDVGRIRCNAALQRGSISLALRLLPLKIPTIDEMDLPPILKEIALKPRGLFMVTGPTGSGKSTTLAAMINYLNANSTCHIVTIEDPIEYQHASVRSAITQRELGADTHSFAEALKHVLRQDPDVVLVGEMRDLETAALVLTLAETGHYILSTGHAPSSTQAIERIVDMFPPHERYLAQTRLASLLIGVICQVLVPRADGSGRIAAIEIMLANNPVRNLIREGKIYQISNVIRTSHEMGMITLDEALVNHYLRGNISGESLLSLCNDRAEVEKLIGKVAMK
jgi:twitching motility protein PilT